MNAIQPITAAERVTQFAGTDLDDLCAATEAAIKKGVEKFGKLDIVFANAGISASTAGVTSDPRPRYP